MLMQKIKRFSMDNKNYTFQPGKNGSLTASPTKPINRSFDIPMKSISKTLIDPAVKKRRMNLNKSIVGSMRG